MPNRVKETLKESLKETYGNQKYWIIGFFICFMVFMYGQASDKPTSIAFGILGCLSSGVMVVQTSRADDGAEGGDESFWQKV